MNVFFGVEPVTFGGAEVLWGISIPGDPSVGVSTRVIWFKAVKAEDDPTPVGFPNPFFMVGVGDQLLFVGIEDE